MLSIANFRSLPRGLDAGSKAKNEPAQAIPPISSWNLRSQKDGLSEESNKYSVHITVRPFLLSLRSPRHRFPDPLNGKNRQSYGEAVRMGSDMREKSLRQIAHEIKTNKLSLRAENRFLSNLRKKR
jgi:hypothetical protein